MSTRALLSLLALLVAACGDKSTDDTGTDSDADTDADADTDTDSDTDADSDTDTDADSDTDTDTDTDADADPTVYDIQQGLIAEGETITLEGVVVTSPLVDADGDATTGFFIAEPEGGPYSGVYVYHGYDVEVVLSQGDEITITGQVSEYGSGFGADKTVTELVLYDASYLTVTGSGVAPAGEVLTTGELSDPDAAEMYEGCLVTVKGVTVADGDLGYGEWAIDDGVVIDDLYYALDTTLYAGDTFTSLSGLVNYSYGAYKLEPRSSADLVGYSSSGISCGGELCMDDLVAGDLVVTEYMANPAACEDSAGEYIEVYNATRSSVDMHYLVIMDAADNTGTISESVVVEAGGYAWFGMTGSTCYGTPDATYSTSLALNNTGDEIELSFAGTVIDTITYTSNETEPGVAWGSSVLNASDNDDMGNWCAQTSAAGATTDFGTPGAANDACE